MLLHNETTLSNSSSSSTFLLSQEVTATTSRSFLSSTPSTNLDCLCAAYDPTALVKAALNETEKSVCRSGFKVLLESYGINSPDNNTGATVDDGSCRAKYLELLPKDYCGLPRGMDPLSTTRSSDMCELEGNSESCQEKMFYLHATCRWFGNHCAVTHPIRPEIDTNGYCATFTTEDECRDESFNVTGNCVWYEKTVGRDTTFPACCDGSGGGATPASEATPSSSPRSESFLSLTSLPSPFFVSPPLPSISPSSTTSTPSSLRSSSPPPSLHSFNVSPWCTSIGLVFDDLNSNDLVEFLGLSCNDVVGINSSFNRKDMLTSRRFKNHHVNDIDDKCCVDGRTNQALTEKPINHKSNKLPSSTPSVLTLVPSMDYYQIGLSASPTKGQREESLFPSIVPSSHTSTHVESPRSLFPSLFPSRERTEKDTSPPTIILGHKSQIDPTKTIYIETEITNGSSDDDSSDDTTMDKKSNIILLSSAPIIFAFARFLWKSRTNALGISRKCSQDHSNTVEDPTAFQHIEAYHNGSSEGDCEMQNFDSDMEFDPSQFEHI